MSSLIFHTDEKQAFVATDTLATHPDGRPFKFTTKAFIVPHLRLLMAGVGIHGFMSRWFVHMNDMVIARGIDNLDYHTPRALSRLWQSYRKELSIDDEMTTTVYHFGFSEATGVMHSYAYRSTNNFASERLEPYGLRVKPECQIPSNYHLPEDLVKIMDDQRAIQASIPKEERIHIGGEIEIHHLTEHGYEVYTFHRFGDFLRDEEAIFDNCRGMTQ